jgi:hypothetical protein
MTEEKRALIQGLYDEFEEMADNEIENHYNGESVEFESLPVEKRLELRHLVLSNIVRVALIHELQDGVMTYEQNS